MAARSGDPRRGVTPRRISLDEPSGRPRCTSFTTMAHGSPPRGRRAAVIGAGSFGTAVAVLLARAGLRTSLQARNEEQVRRLVSERENADYLPGVALPRELPLEPV